ncbi:hypothetical protein CDD81_18 [Ophiocordyceps australis]|uniref:NmrA-like domain-containing protein n=1 Tax=Ophiocordyceps australis TaxID=1399860 RepID=A0A2C5XCK8_9HYPO|nr:hypothetical protein CDD81_18 [Ophiocordyceps australis]
MSIVGVAGGSGALGSLVTKALFDSGKHQVYILSRKAPQDGAPLVRSGLTGNLYKPSIQADYASQEQMTQLLQGYKIDTVICTFGLDFPEQCEAAKVLVRGADQAGCVKRFMPSEFNVDYDLGDDVLVYPEKRLHAAVRRELEQSSLEFTYIYTGMFMDYFGMPHVASPLAPMCVLVDGTHGIASIPGSGKTPMAASYTHDVAKYIVLALDLDAWPQQMTTATSSITPNDLVKLYEQALSHELQVTHSSVQEFIQQTHVVLPGCQEVGKTFPGGLENLLKVTSTLEASIELGAYDFGRLGDHLDLAKHFEAQVPSPMTIEKLVDMAWGKR